MSKIKARRTEDYVVVSLSLGKDQIWLPEIVLTPRESSALILALSACREPSDACEISVGPEEDGRE